LGQRRGLKNSWAGEEDVFSVHPQNSSNGLILNWCTGGCWFTPAGKVLFWMIANPLFPQSLSFGHQLKTQDAPQA